MNRKSIIKAFAAGIFIGFLLGLAGCALQNMAWRNDVIAMGEAYYQADKR